MRTWAIIILASAPVWGQQAISAHSGLVNYVDQDAAVTGPNVQQKNGQFWEIKPGQRLETMDGRAEILLNPGIFLRLDTNSAFRMIDNNLSDSHVELEKGRALVEVVEMVKGNQVTIHVGEALVQPIKEGLYLIDASASEAKVYDGELMARLQGSRLELGHGKKATLAPLLLASKFDRKETDFDLYKWSAIRSGTIAQANLNVATALGQTSSKPLRTGSIWSYYPSYGMFTYLPGYGRRIHNPFGWYYYSPYYIWGIYNQIYTPRNTGYAAENTSWGNRPSAGTYSAPAAVAASTGDVARSSSTATPAVSSGSSRDR